MKKSTFKGLFLTLITATLLLSSCRKEVIYPTNQLPANVPTIPTDDGVARWGEFLVVDAVMYFDNLDNGTHTVYNHFGVGKSRSSLRWGGSMFAIEDIVKDTTTYSFWKPSMYPGIGNFVLNEDTTRYYGVQYTGLNQSIIEDPTHGQQNLGGSARPFSGQTIDATTIAIQIEEVYASVNGQNCHYWTQLTLKKIKSW
jgi:hypothetical protein